MMAPGGSAADPNSKANDLLIEFLRGSHGIKGSILMV
jgi:hypothetical protein